MVLKQLILGKPDGSCFKLVVYNAQVYAASPHYSFHLTYISLSTGLDYKSYINTAPTYKVDLTILYKAPTKR